MANTELLEVAEELGGEGSEVVKELLQQLSDHEEPEP